MFFPDKRESNEHFRLSVDLSHTKSMCSLTTSCTKHIVITTEQMNIQGDFKFKIMPNRGSKECPDSSFGAEVAQSESKRLWYALLD